MPAWLQTLQRGVRYRVTRGGFLFTMAVALRRVDEHGDLFASVLEDVRPLAPAQRSLDRLYD